MRIFPVVAAFVLVAGAAGCSSQDHTSSAGTTPTATPTQAATTAPPTGAAGGKTTVVHALQGNTFSPTSLTLKVGDTVKVVDDDPITPHNFVVDGVGGSQAMQKGDTFSLTFPTAGSYDFVCTYHADLGMTGTVTVS